MRFPWLLFALAAGCIPPHPPVSLAPAGANAQAFPIYVNKQADLNITVGTFCDGFERGLPAKVNAALAGAGYKTASAPAPDAVVAFIKLDIGDGFGGPAVATMTLRRDAHELASVSARFLCKDAVPDPIAIDLVNRIAEDDAMTTAMNALAKLDASAKPAVASTTEPSTAAVIAIFDVEDTSKRFDATTARQVTEYLVARIAENRRYRVVPTSQLRERLSQDKATSYKGCFDESCQIELGKAMSAQKSLATKLLKVGEACVMTSTLYDLRLEATERAASARTECNATALISGVDDIVKQLAERSTHLQLRARV